MPVSLAGAYINTYIPALYSAAGTTADLLLSQDRAQARSPGKKKNVALLRRGMHASHLLALDVFLVELRQESFPVFILKVGVLGQLPSDHERLDVVHGVDVVHAVHHHLSHLLQPLLPTRAKQGAAMRTYVSAC